MVVVADGTAFFWLDGKSKISFFFLVLQISFSGTAARASAALRHICVTFGHFHVTHLVNVSGVRLYMSLYHCF